MKIRTDYSAEIPEPKRPKPGIEDVIRYLENRQLGWEANQVRTLLLNFIKARDGLKEIADMEGNYATIDEALRLADERYREVTHATDPQQEREE